MGDWLFSYDAMDRLTAAAAGGSAPSAFRGQSGGWSYDSYGNRTAQSFSNSVNSSWANYNPANNQNTTASTAVAGYVYDGVPVDAESPALRLGIGFWAGFSLYR